MPREYKKGRKFHSQPKTQSDCGEPVTANFFLFLRCTAEDAPFTA